MKNLLRRCIQEIRGNIGRFIALFLITLIGVGFLAGLLSSAPDMEKTADSYYDSHSFWDINIKSTLGFTTQDIREIEADKNVEKAVGINVLDKVVSLNGENNITVRIITADFDALEVNASGVLSSPDIIKGSFPSNSGGCVVAALGTLKSSIIVGDRLMLDIAGTDLKESILTVTGVAQSPEYMSVERESSNVGSGTIDAIVYISSAAVKTSGVYSNAFVTVKDAKKLNAFSEKYEKAVENAVDSLKELAVVREKARTDSLTQDYATNIDKSQKQIEYKIIEAQDGLKEAAKQIKELEADIEKMKATVSELSSSVPVLKKQYSAIEKNMQALEKLEEKGTITAAQTKTLAEYRTIKSKYESEANSLSSLKTTLKIQEKTLSTLQKEYKKSEKQVGEMAEIEQGRIEAIGNTEIPVYVQKWYIQTRNNNTAFSSFKSNTQKVNAIAKVFPIVFFVVAALVALTTVTRMVDEQRLEIGTLKALGYTKYQIVAKYLMYSGLAAVLGGIGGIIIGVTVLPRVIYKAYGIMYAFPQLKLQFIPGYALPAFFAAVISILAVTVYSCLDSLAEHPAALIMPKAPMPGKRVFLEKIDYIWKKLSFLHKVTARNLFLYKKRFLMAVVGVAGCTALLLTGFGLRDAIGDIVDMQYKQIQKYDLTVALAYPEYNADAKLSDYINSQNVESVLPLHTETAEIIKNDKSAEISMYVPLDSEHFGEFVTLRRRVFKKSIEFDTESVVITEKFASENHIKKGNTIKIKNANGIEAEAVVTGICENYVYNYVYVSSEKYAAMFNEQPKAGMLFVKTANGNAGSDSVTAALLESDIVMGVSFSSDVLSSFADMIHKIDYIVLVLIVSAGLLAFVVLYNLTNINISEREKEIATIRVLGFHRREAASYIFRETFVLSIIGIAIGLFLGIFLNAFVVRTAEVSAAMFGRKIYALSFVLSAVITLVFTLLVDLAMYPRIRKINMAESMKAND